MRRKLVGLGWRLTRVPDHWQPWGGRLVSLSDPEFDRVFFAASGNKPERKPRKDEVNAKIARCWMLKTLLQTLPQVRNVAECGVAGGLSAYVLAHYLQRMNLPEDHRLHLFDSFEGSPVCSSQYNDVATLKPGVFAHPLEEIAQLLHPFPRVELHKGWIPASLDVVADRTFSFVHIDLNVYESYRDALAFFWPRLAAPGIMVFDDYGFPGSRGAKLAVDEFAAEKNLQVVYLPTAQAVVWKYN